MMRFGLFSFDPVSLVLLREGRVVALEPQPARALGLLLARAGSVVTREELRVAIWGTETHVDFDRGLAYVLSQIRTALQDSAANPRFVQTIPRQGYKFIAPVEVPAAPSKPSRRWMVGGIAGVGALAAAGTALWPRLGGGARLAVSVFDNETDNPAFDRWTSSLGDSVVVLLTQLAPAQLAVVGNAAPLRRARNIRNLKALARELDVDYILLGQLQNQGTGLRFITHLIRLPGETHLKANRLYGEAGNLAALESAVIAEFVRAVRQHVLKPASK